MASATCWTACASLSCASSRVAAAACRSLAPCTCSTSAWRKTSTAASARQPRPRTPPPPGRSPQAPSRRSARLSVSNTPRRGGVHSASTATQRTLSIATWPCRSLTVSSRSSSLSIFCSTLSSHAAAPTVPRAHEPPHTHHAVSMALAPLVSQLLVPTAPEKKKGRTFCATVPSGLRHPRAAPALRPAAPPPRSGRNWLGPAPWPARPPGRMRSLRGYRRVTHVNRRLTGGPPLTHPSAHALWLLRGPGPAGQCAPGTRSTMSPGPPRAAAAPRPTKCSPACWRLSTVREHGTSDAERTAHTDKHVSTRVLVPLPPTPPRPQ